jgi:hypothetical protein
MKLILYLRKRYEHWLARRLLEQLVWDGIYDTDLNIWLWMMDVHATKEIKDLSVEERFSRTYESCVSDVDALLVEMIEATRTMREGEVVERKPPKNFRIIRLEDYLVNYQNRPLPLPIIQEQFSKVCKQFIDALTQTKNKNMRAYYRRQYDWLIEEGQRWTEYWCFPNSTN